MPAPNTITPEKLARLIGTPHCPTLVDISPDGPLLVPGTLRREAAAVSEWAAALPPRPVVVMCVAGHGRSAGVAAWLRHAGFAAETLDGGVEGWIAAGLPTVREEVLPPRDELGRTIWVTRARPKVDRIACPWLIRRFVDPDAIFLFVAPGDIDTVARDFGAPFDVEGVFWSHRGALCTFDLMVEELGLAGVPALAHLATIIRGADTAHPEIAPEAAGLLAISLGLSRMYADDIAQLDAGMLVYDALYRWCRDATGETHDWVSHKPRERART